jgi:hypothetical protein
VQACVLQSCDAYWLPTPFSCFPFTSPPVRHRVPSHFKRSLRNTRFVITQKGAILIYFAAEAWNHQQYIILLSPIFFSAFSLLTGNKAMKGMKCWNEDEQLCNLFGPRCPCQTSGNTGFSPLASTAVAAVTAAHCNVKDLVQHFDYKCTI